jgi:hypothetical protein
LKYHDRIEGGLGGGQLVARHVVVPAVAVVDRRVAFLPQRLTQSAESLGAEVGGDDPVLPQGVHKDINVAAGYDPCIHAKAFLGRKEDMVRRRLDAALVRASGRREVRS